LAGGTRSQKLLAEITALEALALRLPPMQFAFCYMCRHWERFWGPLGVCRILLKEKDWPDALTHEFTIGCREFAKRG